MSSRKKKIFTVLGVLAGILAAAYYFLLRETHHPDNCNFKVDLAEVRALANSTPGDKPTALHVERISRFKVPDALVVAGHPWSMTEMTVYAYQLVYPAQTIVLDTALDAKQNEAMQGEDFDQAAFDRLSKAMTTASAIYVTHEHGDHIGGLMAQTSTTAFAHARITPEQLSHPEITDPVVITPEIKARLEPLEYDRFFAAAPGLVLIKAPGHTPGSQLFFVQLADGTEYLLLGDTAWKAASVAEATSPPRMVSFFLRNDREIHLCQLSGLRELSKAEPKLIQIPGHDATVNEPLIARGSLIAKFR